MSNLLVTAMLAAQKAQGELHDLVTSRIEREGETAVIHTKNEFIDELHRFVWTRGTKLPDGYGRIGYSPNRGELLLMTAVADYLHDVPADDLGNWCIHLDGFLVDAFVEFRVAPKWAELRTQYEAEVGYPVCDLVQIHEGGIRRLLVATQLARLMGLLYAGDDGDGEGKWLEGRLNEHFNGQSTVIVQAWDRFVRAAYRKLMPRIKKEDHRGNSGVFGKTTLMTYAIAGRVMFTFERDGESVSFVADDSDMYGCRSGPNVPSTPYALCVEMINDVIDHWDIDKLTESKTVSLGGLT